MHPKLLFLAVMTCLISAANATERIVTTKDYADCANAEDIPVCLLQVISRDRLKPFRFEPQYAARLELLSAIEGPSGDNVRIFDEEDEYYRRAILPHLRLAEASIQALRLDAEGVSPDKALLPLLSGHTDYERQSLFLGQIELTSSSEDRVVIYSSVFDYARTAQKDPALTPPSDAFLRKVVAHWREELKRLDFQDNQHKKYESLAKAYAYLGNHDAAKELFEGATAYWQASLAIWLNDPTTAWEIVNSEVERPQLKSGTRSLLKDILNIADPLLKETIIESMIANKSYHGYISHDTVWQYFNKDQSKRLAGKLISTSAEFTPASGTLAIAMLKSSQQDKLASLIYDWKERASIQPEGPCSSQTESCPKTELRYALASLGRLEEAIDILNTEIVYLFEDEVSYGIGMPSLFDELLETRSLVATQLNQCTKKRTALPWSKNKLRHDISIAAKCAEALVDYSRSPEQLKFETKRWQMWNERSRSKPQPIGVGRYMAAENAMELASVAAIYGEWAIAEQMMTHAFELWNEAPVAKMGGLSTFYVQLLAEAMLEREGRFCICHP